MEYLKDKNFLDKIYTYPIRELYAKIIVMDWLERPVEKVQGVFVKGGNLNLDGNSGMRRNGSLNIFIDKKDFPQIKGLKTLFALNKKIEIQIGIKNQSKEYTEFPILWFPQGVFIASNVNFSHSNSGLNMSIQLRDKMCLLSGECGGTIPASTQFDRRDSIDINGNPVVDKPLISQIIREAVNHIGKEQLGKIIIEDIDNKIKTVMRWIGKTPLYFVEGPNPILTTDFNTVRNLKPIKFEYGDDVGFIYSDFVYPEELVEGAGASVVTLLDKIKNKLGNYDYYYDVDGNFRFKEIKNYLNTRHSTVELEKLKKEDYLVDITKGKVEYDLEGSPLVLSYSNNPQYNLIKNDFIVWGIKKSLNGNSLPIRYHLAIDEKPQIGNIHKAFLYEDPENKELKIGIPIEYDLKNDFPKIGLDTLCYYDKSTQTIYKWDNKKGSYVLPNGEEALEYPTKAQFPYPGEKGKRYIDQQTKLHYLWRTEPSSEDYQNIQKQIKELDIERNKHVNSLNITLKEQQDLISKKTREQEQKQHQIENINNRLPTLQDKYNELRREIDKEVPGLEEARIAKDAAQQILESETELLIDIDKQIRDVYEQFNQPRDYVDTIGQWGKGNIDLWNRPQVPREDGSVSTVESTSFRDDDINTPASRRGKEILIPLVVGDKVVSFEEAVDHYYKTGLYLGAFENSQDATEYGEKLHIQQGILYTKLNIRGIDYLIVKLQNDLIPRQKMYIKTLEDDYKEKLMKFQSLDRLTVADRNKLNSLEQEILELQRQQASLKKEILALTQDIQNTKENIIKLENEIENINKITDAQIESLRNSLYKYSLFDKEKMDSIEANDWRTELFLQGAEAEILGTESNHYYPELKAEWLKIYDLKKESYMNNQGEMIFRGGWKDEYLKHPEDMNYFLDFIDTSSEVGAFSISNIGRRTIVKNKNDINSIFESDIPDYILIKKGQDDTEEKRREAENRGQKYIQIDESIYDMLAIGGLQNSAFNEIKDMLNSSFSFNNTIQITTLPIYNLDVNTLIKVRDIDSDIYGNYLITNISYPLDISGNMNISAKKMIEKI